MAFVLLDAAQFAEVAGYIVPAQLVRSTAELSVADELVQTLQSFIFPPSPAS